MIILHCWWARNSYVTMNQTPERTDRDREREDWKCKYWCLDWWYKILGGDVMSSICVARVTISHEKVRAEGNQFIDENIEWRDELITPGLILPSKNWVSSYQQRRSDHWNTLLQEIKWGVRSWCKCMQSSPAANGLGGESARTDGNFKVGLFCAS